MATRASLAGFLPLIVSLGMVSAAAADGDDMAGRTYALAHCSECHDVGAGRQRPINPGQAPAFTAVANATTTTPLGLEVFLNTPHTKMPNFVVAEDDRHDVIAYILTLRRKPKAPSP